ncbi:MAG: acyltransferase [Clostridia bacterium]|nr:acyltransferase [Clostridia bacterium]
MSKTSRYTYIDALRVICSIMVILTHVVMYYINAFEVKTVFWTNLVFLKALTQFAVPTFFMISGATILSSTKEESYGSFIKRRLSKIAIPFLVYSVIYYLFYVFVKKEYALGIGIFLRKLLRPSISGHFWYIYALIPLYFIFPFLRKLVQSLTKKQLLTLISVFFIINSFMPLLNNILEMCFDMKIGYYSYGKAGVYLNYTLIGYFIHNYGTDLKRTLPLKLSMWATIFISLGAMTVMTYYFSQEKINQTYLDITWPFVIFLSVAVMILAKLHYEQKTVRDGWANFISALGILSFSAYLVHMLYLRSVQIYFPRKILASLTDLESAGLLFAIFAIGVIVCYLWAFIVSKIPIIKKLL